MSRPDPIQYAEHLYAAIRAANFSTLSFLAFGNAVKDGVDLRRMPRIAAEPFMRVVGEMLDLESAGEADVLDAAVVEPTSESRAVGVAGPITSGVQAPVRPAIEIPDASGTERTDLPAGGRRAEDAD